MQQHDTGIDTENNILKQGITIWDDNKKDTIKRGNGTKIMGGNGTN